MIWLFIAGIALAFVFLSVRDGDLTISAPPAYEDFHHYDEPPRGYHNEKASNSNPTGA